MNGDRKPTSDANSRSDKSGSSAFLPLGIVFLILRLAMMILGNLAWIAFFTMGATFLIVGMQKRAKKDQVGETTHD